jgi:hypothetical protein
MSAADSVNEICSLRIELRDSDPPIWREVEVPTSITLKVLHDVVQAAMGWFDQHLWEFRIGQKRFGLPMDEDWGTEPRDEAAKVRLREVLNPRRTVVTYVYDFGDDWEHGLILTNLRQGAPGVDYPRFVAGEGNAPPEDCGGIPGFYEKLQSPIPATPSTTRSSTGSTITTRRPLTRCRSKSLSDVSPSDETPRRHGLPSEHPEYYRAAAAIPAALAGRIPIHQRSRQGGGHRTLTLFEVVARYIATAGFRTRAGHGGAACERRVRGGL